MPNKTKTFITAIITFLIFSLALVSIATAVGSITVTPTAQAPSFSVSIAGTGLGATKAVGIGLEQRAQQTIQISPTVAQEWAHGRAEYPTIQSNQARFVLTSVVVATRGIAIHTDNGDGTLSSESQFFASGSINYVTGQWTTIATIDITAYERVYNATYTRYQYNLTSSTGITTNTTGAFTASTTIPSAITNGNYDVTAIDTSGNQAVTPLTVNNTIPEILPVGIMTLLSSVALVASFHYFRKPHRN
jgi:hypothetical protein